MKDNNLKFDVLYHQPNKNSLAESSRSISIIEECTNNDLRIAEIKKLVNVIKYIYSVKDKIPVLEKQISEKKPNQQEKPKVVKVSEVKPNQSKSNPIQQTEVKAYQERVIRGVILSDDEFLRVLRNTFTKYGFSCKQTTQTIGEVSSTGGVLLSSGNVGITSNSGKVKRQVWNPFRVSNYNCNGWYAGVTVEQVLKYQKVLRNTSYTMQDVRLITSVYNSFMTEKVAFGFGTTICIGISILGFIISPVLIVLGIISGIITFLAIEVLVGLIKILNIGGIRTRKKKNKLKMISLINEICNITQKESENI